MGRDMFVTNVQVQEIMSSASQRFANSISEWTRRAEDGEVSEVVSEIQSAMEEIDRNDPTLEVWKYH